MTTIKHACVYFSPPVMTSTSSGLLQGRVVYLW